MAPVEKWEPSTDSPKADILIRAKSIRTLIPGDPIHQAIALNGGHIWALSEDAHGLDRCIGPTTKIIDEPDSTVLPSFDNTHTHLMFAALSSFDVPVHTAHSIAGILALLRDRASRTKPGEWICTTAIWQEFNIREQRLPTRKELDSVSTSHPIVVFRGGHNIVANSAALELAGVNRETESQPGGGIGRDENGEVNGLLMDTATMFIWQVKPPASTRERIAGLEAASKAYAATGIGCVRDCLVLLGDLPVLKEACDAGKLQVRFRALISAVGLSSLVEIKDLLEKMEEWRELQSGTWLGIWGVKFMLDGGIEMSVMEEPYEVGCGCPTGFRGKMMWEPDILVEVMDLVIRKGWRIGTHAVRDRAVRTLLDVYERLLKRHPHLPQGTFVIEHGGLAYAEQRTRAAALGVAITIQQPLLHDAAGIFAVYVGEGRVKHLFPAREWLDQGALVAGGSDYPLGAYGAMRSVWGMTSRETVVGVRGIEHAISIDESIALHTTMATRLSREAESRDTLAVGRYADLTVWPTDPLLVGDMSELKDMAPLHTIVGGKIVYSRP